MRTELDAAAAAAAQGRLDALAEGFVEHFARRGRTWLPAEPTIAADPTILFTNSAVVSFKRFIRGDAPIPSGGAFVVQPCVRAHNLRVLTNDEFHPEFLLRFGMVGVIAAPDGLADLTGDIDSYFTATGLDADVIFRVAADDADLQAAVADRRRVTVERDTRKRAYFRWTFGDEGMTGRGATYAVRNHAVGHRDLGNLIAFEWQGETVAYGFGIGLQSVASCQAGVEFVLDTTPAGAGLAPRTPREAKLIDLIDLLAGLLAERIPQSSRGAGRIARQAALGAVGVGAEFGLAPVQLARWLTELVGLAGATATVEEALAYLSPAPVSEDTVTHMQLSFDCPGAYVADELAESLRRAVDSDGRAADPTVRLVDTYRGASLGADRVGHSFEVGLRLPAQVRAMDVLRAVVAAVTTDGIRLRGQLNEG